jgi:hypothetical protein
MRGIASRPYSGNTLRIWNANTGECSVKIKTNFDYPPIPVRSFDWSAIDEDTYDCDCDQDGFFSLSPIGHGATETEAIADLMDQLEEAA